MRVALLGVRRGAHGGKGAHGVVWDGGGMGRGAVD